MTKLEIARQKLGEQGIDAFLVSNEYNQHYLSDFAFQDGLLLITAKKAYLITDKRYDERAGYEASREFEVVVPKNRSEFIGDILSGEGCRTLGFEGGTVSYAAYKRYRDTYPDVEFVDVGDMTEKMREIKLPYEIEYMQKAQDVTDKAFAHLLSVIKPDMTEIEVAAELEYAMRRNGATGIAFETIAVSGVNSTHPHGVPRNVKLGRGFLTMDFGASYNGYCSDMTRTIVIGSADDEMKRVYDTVLRAQCAVLEAIDWHSNCAEMDKIARDIIDNAGYKGKFGHSLGHGVGLYIHEKPGLNSGNTSGILENGHVVTVEPGIYLEGQYGVRIEDMVMIHNNRAENITKSRKDLIIL